MKLSQVQKSEDRRWNERNQELVWRHQAALALVKEEPVLDIGGGDGLFLRLLRERDFQRLKLLDISPVAVEKARRKGLEAEAFDITKPLPFAEDAFGTVCALDLLEHVYDPLPTLKEMARVGRSVVVVVPNFHYWKERLHMVLGKVPFQCKPQRGHVYWFNNFILQNLITQSGLEVDNIIFGGFRRFGPLGNWLAQWYPNVFAHSFAVRLKKYDSK